MIIINVYCCQSCLRVNAEGRQFVNLLSIDVCEEELIKTVEQMTVARVKTTHVARDKMQVRGRSQLSTFMKSVQTVR